jgi:thiopeptide-type bacteriocin biosynthesis protein
LALVGIDRWLMDLGLDLEAKYALMQRLREGFGREFAAGKQTRIQLGNRFRAERRELQSLFESDEAGMDGPLAPGFAALRRRSAAMAPHFAELRSRWAAGRISLGPNELAGTFVHMFTNRLIRSSARAHEMVLYDFLERLYDSAMARRRAASRSRP